MPLTQWRNDRIKNKWSQSADKEDSLIKMRRANGEARKAENASSRSPHTHVRTRKKTVLLRILLKRRDVRLTQRLYCSWLSDTHKIVQMCAVELNKNTALPQWRGVKKCERRIKFCEKWEKKEGEESCSRATASLASNFITAFFREWPGVLRVHSLV